MNNSHSLGGNPVGLVNAKVQKVSMTLNLCTAVFEINNSEAITVLRAVMHFCIIF